MPVFKGGNVWERRLPPERGFISLYQPFCLACRHRFRRRHQGAENNQEESWNIAVFGVHSPTEAKKEESLEFAAVVEIDRESLELKTEYIPVRDGAYDVQNKESGYPDLGIRYDDYVAFNWKDLVDAINILGGVETVISDEEYVYINAYVTQTVAETGIASTRISKAGLRYIDGVQAVAYSRMKLSENDAEQVKKAGKDPVTDMEEADAYRYPVSVSFCPAISCPELRPALMGMN